MSLQQIAKDLGLKVECRPIPVEELAEMDEASECGTAAVCSPISEIFDYDKNKTYILAKDGKPGPITTQLYKRLQAIQKGEYPDHYGWLTVVDL